MVPRVKLILGTLLGLSNLASRAEATPNFENPGTVQLGVSFQLRWDPFDDSGDATKYDILLYQSTDCSGELLANLCEPGVDPEGASAKGCGDSSGDYNVVIPASTGAGTRSILLRLHDDPAESRCSGQFSTTETQPQGAPGSSLVAYAPGSSDIVAGVEFEARWAYDDGNGASTNRFYIDLYAADCSGSKLATLCPEPDGCLDNVGDYTVTIPSTIPDGQYSLKIGVFSAATPWGCSPAFAVGTSTGGSSGVSSQSPVVETPWPDQQVAKVPCDPSIPFQTRYAATTERVYFEHTDGLEGGCATLTDILTLRSERNGTIKGPLYPIDPVTGAKKYNVSEVTGHWLIESDLYIRNGITLKLYGNASGGDCDALRIMSTNTKHFNLRAHGGNLDIMDTIITSWDTNLSPPAPRTADHSTYEDDTEPRSYISCLSEIITDDTQTCYGRAKFNRGECRMDIVRSEIAYMGYFGSEAYGLTWKVRGFCKNKSNPQVFDVVNTYGDVIDSNIHHLFYGLYTYGHTGGLWVNNLMHDNEWYGFDPHDDSDYLTIHNNLVWGNGKHGIIASKRCNHVSIQNNEVWDGGATAAGIFLHRSSDYAIVKNNYVHDMQDAGLATLESFHILFANNTIERSKYGIRLSLGAANNLVFGNTFKTLTSYGFFTYVGSNTPDVSNTFRPYNNVFVNNYIEAPAGGKLKKADGTVLTGNVFVDTVTLEIDDSQTTTFILNNYDTEATTVSVKNEACFQPGSDLTPSCT